MSKEEVKFNFTRAEIIFSVGDKEFYIPKDQFLRLLDQRFVADQFLDQETPDNHLDELNNLETVALYMFWTQKGLTMEQVAEKLTITVQKLKNWVTREQGYINLVLRTKGSAVEALIAQHEAAPGAAKRG